MKKRMILGVTAAALALSLAACAESDTQKEPNNSEQVQQEKPNEKEPEQKPEEEQKQPEPEVPDASQQPEQPQQPVTEKKVVTIYSGNANADGYNKEEVSVDSLTPEVLLNQLIVKGVVPADVKVQKFEQKDMQGTAVLDLDLSQSFGTYVNGLGTSGEQMAIGSLCNTYLDAYQAAGIRITVNGGALESGHAEYPGYLTHFE